MCWLGVCEGVVVVAIETGVDEVGLEFIVDVGIVHDQKVLPWKVLPCEVRQESLELEGTMLDEAEPAGKPIVVVG